MGDLKLEEMTKIYDEGGTDLVAVENLSIDITEGEFLVLVGPSGCGKSTTLQCIAGLEEVSEGEILLDNEPITGRKPKDRHIAMVFQNYALYPHMTARENMAFGLKMTTDLTQSEIDDRIEEAAVMMGIEELLEQKPRELSGGQQQRVALGRAIVREPEVFLLDEPLSNLDAKLRTTMRTELQNLQQELDVTTIYVTHDQTEAMTMGDRIAILNEGKLQQIGTPLECYHEPKNQFVAGFIGSPSMNFFDVAVTHQGGQSTLVHDAFEYQLSEDTTRQLDDSHDRLILGIRPENIRIGEDSDPDAITSTVSVTEPLGDMTHVYFDVAGKTYTASLVGGVQVTPGEQLDVVFPEECIHLFEPDSGMALVNSSITDEDIHEYTERGTGTV